MTSTRSGRSVMSGVSGLSSVSGSSQLRRGLTKLPKSILSKIMGYVPQIPSLSMMSGIENKRIQAAALEPALWRTVELSFTTHAAVSDAGLGSLIPSQAYEHVRTLVAEHAIHWSPQALEELLGRLGKLKELYLGGCTRLQDTFLSVFVGNLRTLDLSGCTSLTDDLPLAKYLSTASNLKELNLEGTNVTLSRLGVCPEVHASLVWLNISQSQVGPAGFAALAKAFPRLQSLVARSMGARELRDPNAGSRGWIEVLRDVGSLSQLAALNLSNNTALTSEALIQGGALPASLYSLSLAGCSSLEGSLTDLWSVLPGKSLKFLALAGVPRVDTESILRFASRAPKLAVLVMHHHLGPVSETVVSRLVRDGRSLQVDLMPAPMDAVRDGNGPEMLKCYRWGLLGRPSPQDLVYGSKRGLEVTMLSLMAHMPPETGSSPGWGTTMVYPHIPGSLSAVTAEQAGGRRASRGMELDFGQYWGRTMGGAPVNSTSKLEAALTGGSNAVVEDHHFEWASHVVESHSRITDLVFPDDQGRTLVSYAAERGAVDILEWAYSQGDADFEFADNFGATPAHYAAESGAIPSLMYFSSLGLDLRNVADDSGVTPLDLALAKDQLGAVSVIKGLVSMSRSVSRRMSLVLGQQPSVDLTASSVISRPSPESPVFSFEDVGFAVGDGSDLWISSSHFGAIGKISDVNTNSNVEWVGWMGLDAVVKEIVPSVVDDKLLLLISNTTTQDLSIRSCSLPGLSDCETIQSLEANCHSIAQGHDGAIFWIDAQGNVMRNGNLYWVAGGLPANHIAVTTTEVYASRGGAGGAYSGLMETKSLSSGVVSTVFTSHELLQGGVPGRFVVSGRSIYFLYIVFPEWGDVYMGTWDFPYSQEHPTGVGHNVNILATTDDFVVYDNPLLNYELYAVPHYNGGSYVLPTTGFAALVSDDHAELVSGYSRRVLWDEVSSRAFWAHGNQLMVSTALGDAEVFLDVGTAISDIDLDPIAGTVYVLHQKAGSGSYLTSVSVDDANSDDLEWSSTINYLGIAYHPATGSLVVQGPNFMSKLTVEGWSPHLMNTGSFFVYDGTVSADPRSSAVYFRNSVGALLVASLDDPDMEAVEVVESMYADTSPKTWVSSLESELLVGLSLTAKKVWVAGEPGSEDSGVVFPDALTDGLFGGVGLAEGNGVLLGILGGGIVRVPLTVSHGKFSDENCGEIGCGDHGSCESAGNGFFECVCQDGHSGDNCEVGAGEGSLVASTGGLSLLVLIGILVAAVIGATRASSISNPESQPRKPATSHARSRSYGQETGFQGALPVARPPAPSVVPRPMTVHRPTRPQPAAIKQMGLPGGFVKSGGLQKSGSQSSLGPSFGTSKFAAATAIAAVVANSSNSYRNERDEADDEDDDTSVGSSMTLRTDTSHSTNGRPTEELLRLLASSSLTHLLGKLVAAHIDDNALNYLSESTLLAAGLLPGDAARIMGHLRSRGPIPAGGSMRSRPRSRRRSRSSNRSRPRRESVESTVDGVPPPQTYTTVPISKFRSKVPLGRTATLTSIQAPTFER